jgi:hypothetical protein
VLSATAEGTGIVEGVDFRADEVVAGRKAKGEGDVRPPLIGDEVLRAPSLYSIG